MAKIGGEGEKRKDSKGREREREREGEGGREAVGGSLQGATAIGLRQELECE